MRCGITETLPIIGVVDRNFRMRVTDGGLELPLYGALVDPDDCRSTIAKLKRLHNLRDMARMLLIGESRLLGVRAVNGLGAAEKSLDLATGFLAVDELPD
jgi:hypothetical protein